MRSTVLLSSAALFAFTALAVQAQDGAALLARLDQNADGQVTEAEVIAQRTEQFARFDLNGDGFIDKAELAQLQQVIDNMASMGRIVSTRQFSQLDTNGDGVVSLPEMQVTGRGFKLADHNGDGSLSVAEIEAIAAMLANR